MKSVVNKILFTLAVFVMLVYCLAPLIWMMLTSIKPASETVTFPPTYMPEEVSFKNYVDIFTVRPFGRYILNSLIVSVGTMLLCLGVGAPAAYSLARLRIRGGELTKNLILLVALFPQVVLIIPIYEMVIRVGLINNPLALIFPYTALNLPFVVWVLAGFFRQIPQEIEDAARVDGYSPIGVLTGVILPLSLPALATTAIIVFIFAWNEFIFALTFMTYDAARTVSVGISMLSGTTLYEIPWGQIAAAVVVSTLPVVLLVLIFQRKILRGLTTGAVKG
jgi:multiple sugar transport system permease protein